MMLSPGSRLRKQRIGLVALLVLFLLGQLSLRAADLPDSKDHPLIKRFGGSEIVGYDVKRFDLYTLQTSTYKSYDFSGKRRVFVNPPLQLEGTVTRIWYEAAGQASSVELLRNYQNELQSKQFKILYDSSKDPAAKKWNGYFSHSDAEAIRTSRSQYVFSAARDSSIAVATAKLERPEGNVYVQLTAVQWDKDHPTYKARQGAYIAVDIIEEKAMVQNMVTVSAGEMAKAIGATGRVALYGIFFDFNKADIKLESKPALDEIAKLLKNEPALKLFVVGHTDNVGGLDANMVLSKNRADAVVRALQKDYGVDPSRLKPHGVAFLAPTAPNTTDEGRAKNRRVELVPQS